MKGKIQSRLERQRELCEHQWIPVEWESYEEKAENNYSYDTTRKSVVALFCPLCALSINPRHAIDAAKEIDPLERWYPESPQNN